MAAVLWPISHPRARPTINSSENSCAEVDFFLLFQLNYKPSTNFFFITESGSFFAIRDCVVVDDEDDDDDAGWLLRCFEESLKQWSLETIMLSFKVLLVYGAGKRVCSAGSISDNYRCLFTSTETNARNG